VKLLLVTWHPENYCSERGSRDFFYCKMFLSGFTSTFQQALPYDNCTYSKFSLHFPPRSIFINILLPFKPVNAHSLFKSQWYYNTPAATCFRYYWPINREYM